MPRLPRTQPTVEPPPDAYRARIVVTHARARVRGGTGSIKGVKKREAKERDPKEKEGSPS